MSVPIRFKKAFPRHVDGGMGRERAAGQAEGAGAVALAKPNARMKYLFAAASL